jgi:hypothetical protein
MQGIRRPPALPEQVTDPLRRSATLEHRTMAMWEVTAAQASIRKCTLKIRRPLIDAGIVDDSHG